MRRRLNDLGRLGLAASLAALVLAMLRWGPVYAAAPWPVRAAPAAAVALGLGILCALSGVERGPARLRTPLLALAAAAGLLALVVATRGPAGLDPHVVTTSGELGSQPRGPVDLVGKDLAGAPASRKWWITWKGALRVPDGGVYRLWVDGRGEATVAIDGVEVLRASGERFQTGAPVRLSAGERQIEARLTRIGPGLRLRLGWVRPGGFAETIPPRRLGPLTSRAGWIATDVLALMIAGLVGLVSLRLRWDRPARLSWSHPVSMREVAVSLLGYVLLVALMSWPLVRDLRHLGVVDRPDGRLNAWILAWDAHAVHHGLPLWSAPIFHPLPDALAFSENLLLPALLVAPAQSHGGPVLAYNLVLLLSLVTSGLAVQLLVRRVCDDPVAAFVAGAFFAVGAHRWIRLAHLHAQVTTLLPLALLALDRFWEKRTWPRALGFGALVGLQGLISVYLAAITAMMAAVAGALALVRLTRRERLALLAGFALAGAIVAPVGAAYLRMRSFEGMEWTLSDVKAYATTIESYAASGTRLYGGITQRHLDPDRVQDTLFPGVVLLVAGIAGFSKAPTRFRLVALVASVVAVVFSLGPETAAYRFLHEHLILIRGVRALSRFSLIPVLCLSVLGGLALAERRLAAGVALALFLLESSNAPLRFATYAGPKPAARWLAGHEGAVAYLPLGENDTQAMLDGVAHWHPLVNGDSGFIPRPYTRAMELLDGGDPADGLRFLRAAGVRYVVARDERPLPVAAAFADERVYAVPPGEAATVVTEAPMVATQFAADGITVDLGRAASVTRIVFEPDDRAWIAHPRVEVSADGVAWTPVDATASLADATLSLMHDPRHARGEVRLTPTASARFVRLPALLPCRPQAFMVE